MKKSIDSLIEELEPERKAEMRKVLESRVPVPSSSRESKPRRRGAILSVCASLACVICLAVILPIALLRDGNDTSIYSLSDCTVLESEKSLKGYGSESTWAGIGAGGTLYWDRYDYAEVKTYEYTVNGEVVLISENITLSVSTEKIVINVHKNDIRFDELESDRKACTSNRDYKNIHIKWNASGGDSVATFEYNGFTYYVRCSNVEEPEAAVRVAEEMLENI